VTGKTTIEWTWLPGYEGAVWNPSVGCTRVSAGCDNCYAFALHDKRYASNRKAASPVAVRDYRDSGGKGLPWPKQYDLPFSRVHLFPDRLDAPLRKRKPTCYFVDSMADLFHEEVRYWFIDRVFLSMAKARQHRFLILTKRPERMRAYMEHALDELRYDESGCEVVAEHLAHVWLGTSIEDQRSADERIPHLLETPAAVRFLSCEPLLGPVDLTVHLERSRNNPLTRHLDWVIVGGESGSRARPFDLAWARSLRDQCASAGTAFFMKQCGSKPTDTTGCRVCADDAEDGDRELHAVHLREAHGRDPDEWPDDLRIRQFPEVKP
jgi:protein gp37